MASKIVDFVKSKLKPGVRRSSVGSSSAGPSSILGWAPHGVMKIQEDRPRQMMKDERMYDSTV